MPSILEVLNQRAAEKGSKGRGKGSKGKGKGKGNNSAPAAASVTKTLSKASKPSKPSKRNEDSDGFESVNGRSDDDGSGSEESEGETNQGEAPVLGRKKKEEALKDSLAEAREAIKAKKKAIDGKKACHLAKKTSKKGPLEVVSSRRAYDVSGLALRRKNSERDVASNGRAKNVIGDPRFSDLCGSLDVHAVSRNYGFVDEARDQERRDMAKERNRLLKGKKGQKSANKEKAEEIKDELKRMTDQDRRRVNLRDEAEMKARLVKEQKQKLLESGGAKQVYHFSDAKIRYEVRKERDSKMSTKALEKRDAKREKRQAAEERKTMVKRRVD